jgi:glycosyltransferase involved in cell wall biosynthesis
VLTVSLPFRDELTARGVARERIEVVHNAIRPDWGTVAPAERATWRIPEGRPIVLIVGRLSKEKDHLMLLDAVGRLPAGRKPHVLIVGEGPERPAIEEAIRDRGMEGWVTLTGQQPSAESFYGISAAAVLCSLSEGSPNALLEAMAAGVPVVATRVGGVPEIVVHEESALLIEPGDTEGLTRSLDRVLMDRTLAEKLIQAARNRVREHHTPQARVARLASIYRDVAGARC